jgi:hypothetical protein
VRHRADQRLAQRVRFGAHPGAPHAGRQLAGHHRDDNEQDEVDEVDRVMDSKIVDRLVEEKRGGPDSDRGGEHRRDHAAANRTHQHRDQIDDGHGLDGDEALQRGKCGCQRGDQQQRNRRRGRLSLQGLVAQPDGKRPFANGHAGTLQDFVGCQHVMPRARCQ